MKPTRRSAARLLAHTGVLLAAALLLSTPVPAQHEERTVDIAGLAASHVRPAGREHAPLVVIIAGSGPTDRDGNSVLGLATDAYKLFAHGLAAQGVASVRYDKRGVAGSAGIALPEPEFTVDTFAKDAAAVAVWAGKQPGAGPVTLIGHSEGGLLALLAASHAKAKAIVLLASPGRPFAAILRDQLARPPGLPPPFSAEASTILAALERGELVPSVSAGLAALFRPSVQPYLISVMRIDPAQRLRALTGPVLVVGGGKDVQIGRADFDALIAARPGLEAFWAPAMGHTLKAVGDDPASQERTYTDPTLPLLDGLAARIAVFLHAAR